MFDIGFWELVLVAVIGLVVLGPERLPVAIRTVRSWMRTIRQLTDSVKTELTEELRINELHQNLKKAEQSNMQNLSPDVTAAVKSLHDAAASVTEPFKKSLSTEQTTTDNSTANKSATTQDKLNS